MRSLFALTVALLFACGPLDNAQVGPEGPPGPQGAMGAMGVPGRDGVVASTSPILVAYVVGGMANSTQPVYADYTSSWSAILSNRKMIFVPAGFKIAFVALNLRDKALGNNDVATLEVQEGATFQAITTPLQKPAKAQLTGAEQSVVVAPGSTLNMPWVSLVLTLTGPDSYTGNVEAFVWASP